MRLFFLAVIVGIILGGCRVSSYSVATDSTATITLDENADTLGLTLPGGFIAETVMEDLVQPTQMVKGPDGTLWVAQQGSTVNSSAGNIVVIDVASGERQVVVNDLRKPTGIAIIDEMLWIATERDLLAAPLLDGPILAAVEGEEGGVGTAVSVLEELPFDGRSNGTLTITPQRKLLFETSGARFGGSPLEGSATLWRLDPAAPAQPVALATGLKSAYAHTFHGEDGLWFSDVGHDSVNGKPPPDELNFLRLKSTEPPDYGWPKCFGMQEPAYNYGGVAEECADTRAPVLLFEPSAAPTSVVLSPFAHNELLVALRGTGEIVRVVVSYEDGEADGSVEPFVGGLRQPQHLLVWNNKTLFVSEFESGRILSISLAADG